MANLENGFLVLYDWLPALESLPAQDMKKLLLALIDLQKNGIPLPRFTNNQAAIYAQMIEPTIRRRLEGKRSSRNANTLGGTPKGTPEAPPKDTPEGTPDLKQRESRAKISRAKAKISREGEKICNVHDEEEQSKAAPPPITNKEEPPKLSHGEFSNVFLSEEEWNALADKYGESVAKRMIDNLSRRIKAKGYQYEDHYATILDWANKDGVKPRSEKSYDVDDFFAAAVERSYAELEEQDGARECRTLNGGRVFLRMET